MSPARSELRSRRLRSILLSIELMRPGPCARAGCGATNASDATSISAARDSVNNFFMRTPSNGWETPARPPAKRPDKYRELRLYVNLVGDRAAVDALDLPPPGDAQVGVLGDAPRAALNVVSVGLRGGGPRRPYKQLVCRSEPTLMRGRAGEFPPLEPAFRRQEYEGENQHAQHVVLPSRAP